MAKTVTGTGEDEFLRAWCDGKIRSGYAVLVGNNRYRFLEEYRLDAALPQLKFVNDSGLKLKIEAISGNYWEALDE